MLELRPICENCAVALPPAALNAMICTFECTFCRSCVVDVLGDVCPNCGGGLCPRPIRPTKNWNDDNYLGAHPPTQLRRHRPVDPIRHERFSAPIRTLAPNQR